MRLLFVSNFYPPHDLGGYEKHCHEVAIGLQARGHNVQVLTSLHGVGAAVQEGHVRRALYLESDLRHYSPVYFFLHHGREESCNVAAVRSTIAITAPDAILVWGMWNLSRRVPDAVERSGIPAAYWLGDTWPLEPDTHTRYWQHPAESRVGRVLMPLLARLALRRLAAESYPPTLAFRHVACGSDFLQRKLAAQLPAFADARVVLCGVDLAPYAGYRPHQRLFDAAAPRIIYVGSLGAHKGVHTAIEAMAQLLWRRPDLQPSLTIVGSGHPDYEARLRQLANECGSPGCFRFMGTVQKESVPILLAEHDILVVPSAWEEPFGRVIVEGMAAGLAVVGTATGGSAEILQDGTNGLVFPVENADALARCLLRLVSDPVLYARLTRAGKATSERFDLRDMIDGIERFLFDVADSVAGGAET